MTYKDTIIELYRLTHTAGPIPLAAYGDVLQSAKTIRRAAAILQREREASCDGVRQPEGYTGWSEEDEARSREIGIRAFARANAAFRKILGDSTFELRQQRDPRAARLEVFELGAARDASPVGRFS